VRWKYVWGGTKWEGALTANIGDSVQSIRIIWALDDILTVMYTNKNDGDTTITAY